LSSEKSSGFIYLQKYKSLTPTPTKVYALDRLETPSNDFSRIQKRAITELGTSLHYRRIDVRDQQHLNAIVEEIATKRQRLDGLIAAAGIQQETPALEYTAKDSDLMMSINVTGCFMTAQAAAKQMVRFGNGGSVVLIASMSGTIANRVSSCLSPFAREETRKE
jgi:NADP-dependent 3-hydroxy acid dehydrogenase YdfG